MLVKLLLLAVLSILTWQDLKYRAVYWWLFPVLACSELYLLQANKSERIGMDILVNYSLLAFQLAVLTIFYSVKSGCYVNITKGLLCWGDILFLLCIALALSPQLFILFNILSLSVITIAYLPQKSERIPLAGLQAFLYGLLMIGEWNFGILRILDNYLLMFIDYGAIA